MAKKIASMTDREKTARLKTMAAKEGAKRDPAARLLKSASKSGTILGDRTKGGAKMGGSEKFKKGEYAKVVITRSGGGT